MKIIYLHQYFNTPEMPGGTRSYEMARRLVALGHEVHMVTSWRSEHETTSWFTSEEAGIKVHWLPVPYSNSMSYRSRIMAFFRFAFRAMQKARALKGDIVFATSTPLTIAIPGVYAAFMSRIPLVFEVRDLWPEMPIAVGALNNPLLKFLAKRFEFWAYRHSDAIIALSPGMKEGVVASGFPSSRVAVIPNSSDNALFINDKALAEDFRNARAWLGDKPLILYAGAFGRVNDVGYFADLAVQLDRIIPDARILLIGAGLEYEKVRVSAEEKGVLGKNLFIEHSLPKNMMPAAFAAADIACSVFRDIPEMRVNSANKFFDALASGTPVLLNYGGWQADLLKQHQCGLVVWELSIKEAAIEISSLLTDDKRRAEYGNAAKAVAEKYFDRDKLAGFLEEVLIKVSKGENTSVESIAPGVYH